MAGRGAGVLETLAKSTRADLDLATERLRRLAEDLDEGLRQTGAACDQTWEPPALGVEGPTLFEVSAKR